MTGRHMVCKVPSAQGVRKHNKPSGRTISLHGRWSPHLSGSPGGWLRSSSLAATPRQSSCHSVLCSHTYRPSLGASTGWGQEESQQISHERLLACPSQPGFHENTRHGRLCEFPLPVGQESHPPSAVGSSTAWPALTASRTQVCSHVQLGICILGFLLLLWAGHVGYHYFY